MISVDHIICLAVPLLLILLTTVPRYECSSEDVGCAPLHFEDSSVVCVCNSTYCDTINNVTKINAPAYESITSSQCGLRFKKDTIPFAKKDFNCPADITLKINKKKLHQTIFGFGGAFTDSVGINYYNLTTETRKKILKAYYSSDEGIGYTFGRVPFGGTDFSTHLYMYDEGAEDLPLRNFRLAYEDFIYKIPLLKEAQKLMKQPIKLFGTTWFAPGWIKESGNISIHSPIKGKPGGIYFKAWAQYFIRFLQEYEDQGFRFWGMSTQNEPYVSKFVLDGLFIPYTAQNLSDFAALDLGPALHSAGYGDLHLMVYEDLKAIAYEYAIAAYSPQSKAKSYLSGMSIHDYEVLDMEAYPMLDAVHDLAPNKFIFTTEYCEGIGTGVLLGNWERAENYSHKISQSLNHWSVGWIDWNLVLNKAGGPSFINIVDSPIIVDPENDQFFKQPMFYAMGHYSKFLHPGSIIIDVSVRPHNKQNFDFVAAVRPDKATVVVLGNRDKNAINVKIQDGKTNIATTVPAHSIKTYIWWN